MRKARFTEDQMVRILRAAFQRRAYWQWFKAWLRLCSAQAQRIGSRPVLAQASDAERVWEAGHEGEQRLTERLAAQMNDDWTLVSGYRNQKGELDAVLVGPEAIVAIEIKNLNGEIHVNRDVWTRDKDDKHGN